MNTNHFHGLRTLVYRVSDMDSAKKWYTEALGVAPYFDEPFYIGFNVGGFEVGLALAHEEVIFGNNINCYLGVTNAHESYDRLLSFGATTHQAPRDVGEGIIVASVYDPFGNIFGVIENPHFALPT